MKDKNDINLKRMSRGALLEMLLEQADEMEELQRDKAELEKKAEAGMEAEARLNAEREQYKANLAVIKRKVDSNIAAMRKHTAELEGKIRKLEAENEELRNRSSEGDPEIIAALQTERDSARKALIDLRAASEKRIAGLEEKLRNSEAEADELRRRCDNTADSADVEQLRKELSEKADAAQKAEEEAATFRRKAEDLLNELAESKRRRWKRRDRNQTPPKSGRTGSKRKAGRSAGGFSGKPAEAGAVEDRQPAEEPSRSEQEPSQSGR